MTLDEAIKELTYLRDGLGGDVLLVQAKDSEGNGFSPVMEFDYAMYAADSTYSGDRYMTEVDRLLEDDPDDYSQAPEDAVMAVFVWPTN